MTKLSKLVMVAIVALLLASCAPVHQQIAMTQPVDLTKLKLGMSKADVQLTLNKKPDNIVSSMHDSVKNATIEVVQYSQWSNNNANSDLKKLNSFWLYFANDKLDSWEEVHPDHKNAY